VRCDVWLRLKIKKADIKSRIFTFHKMQTVDISVDCNKQLSYRRERTVSKLLQLIIEILDTAFLSHPLGGLGTTYDVHLRLIGKCGLPISVK